MYLVIHDNHSAAEEIVVGDDAREPLGGWVLSVNSYTVAIQWIGTWRYQEPETFSNFQQHFSVAYLLYEQWFLTHYHITWYPDFFFFLIALIFN